jgi:putative transposase
MSNDLKSGNHFVFKLHVHFVFVTKYRKNVFNKEILKYLRSVFAFICKKYESELMEFEGEADYVHLLIFYLSKMSVSLLVNGLKGISSRIIRQYI